MMTAKPAQPNAYFRTKVMTANPMELRLMLFEGAIRFADMARTGISERNHEQSYEGITRCQAILIELINTLKPEHDQELCRNLAALYTFMYTRMIDAGRERDSEKVNEVLELLNYERETWVLLMEQLASENTDASSMHRSTLPAPSPIPAPQSPDKTSGLVGGRVSLEG